MNNEATMNNEMTTTEVKRCPAVEILLEIRDRLRNLDTLEERRMNDRKRQQACRANATCHVTPSCHVTKRRESGKEGISPHTPFKGEKGKEEENAFPRARVCSENRDELFARFWTAYPGPRKRCKAKCRAKFYALLKNPATRQATFDRIMVGLDRWKRHDSWIRDGGRFIQGPLVWINNEDWDAEIAVGSLSSGPADARTAAFGRQQAEAERNLAHANAVVEQIFARRQAEMNGGAA